MAGRNNNSLLRICESCIAAVVIVGDAGAQSPAPYPLRNIQIVVP